MEKKIGILWVREEIEKNAEDSYREFHESLVPGLEKMKGVRIPKLRQISQRAARESYGEIAEEADLSVYEELMIRGMMIGYAKLSEEEQREELKKFIPHINNWAVCDSCCSTYKFMKKNQEEWFEFLLSYGQSQKEYEIRFALVCMLDFFVKEEFLSRMFELFSKIRHEGYYVKMAAAWAVSVCFVKFPQETEAFLKQERLDVFTHNKAIQKIRESYRVSREDKEKLKEWRRKEEYEGKGQG